MRITILFLLGIALSYGQLSSFQFDSIPASAIAGDSFRLVVTARDAGGAIYPYSGGATIQSTRSSHFSFQNVLFNNGWWKGNALITLADTGRLECREPGGRFGYSSLISITPSSPARLLTICPTEAIQPGAPGVFNVLPRRTGTVQIQTAGRAFNFTVYLTDVWTNPVNFGNDTITFSSTDNFAAIPWGTLNNGQAQFSANMRTATNNRIFAFDRNRVGVLDSSSQIPVFAGSYQQVLVLLPGETHLAGDTTMNILNTPGKAGSPALQFIRELFAVKVYAVDSCWNRTSSPQDTIVIQSNFPDSVVPARAALVGGEANFQVSFNTQGDNQDIWARDINNGFT